MAGIEKSRVPPPPPNAKKKKKTNSFSPLPHSTPSQHTAKSNTNARPLKKYDRATISGERPHAGEHLWVPLFPPEAPFGRVSKRTSQGLDREQTAPSSRVLSWRALGASSSLSLTAGEAGTTRFSLSLKLWTNG